ncbi:hypothetical protein DEO23_14195 [Brachybacterium endophyticum]|uniref:Uncharacterized protein n=1 Tax=Brachybacterium endophyticum TaxID=2182385 RepID=A0A2U2RH93_9MICO|nr:hypothetical protein DEO23_14195 [Brachybacterium endophyticum]
MLDLLLTPGVLTPLASIAGVIVTAFLAVRATKQQSRDLTRQLNHQTEQASADRHRGHEAQLRGERLEVYRRYLEVSDRVALTFRPVVSGTWQRRSDEAEAADRDEWHVRTEVELLASHKVASAARDLHSSQQERRKEWARRWSPQGQRDVTTEDDPALTMWGTALDPLVQGVSFLTHLMRQEMTAGVEEPPTQPGKDPE